MNVQFKTFSGEVKNWDDNEMWIEHFISTELQDSGGDIMLAGGMKMRGKPVVLFQHGLDPKFGNEPIAKVLDIRVGEHKGKKGLIAKTKYFDGSKLTPPDATGQRLYMKAKDGTMPNWSIGFNSLKERPIKGGRVVEEWELHEYSQVAVGMNSEASTIDLLSTSAPELKFIIKTDDPVEPEVDEVSHVDTISALVEEKSEVIPEVKSEGTHQRVHKTLRAIHKRMITDLKEAVDGEDFVETGASTRAQEAIEDFTDGAMPHLERYIKIVRSMKADEMFGDEEENEEEEEGEVEEKAYGKPLRALNKAFNGMVKEMRACKGNQSVVPAIVATNIAKAHEEAANPHAVSFIKEMYESRKNPKISIMAPEENSPIVPADGEKSIQKLTIVSPPVQNVKVSIPESEKVKVIGSVSNSAQQLITPELVKELIADAQARTTETIRVAIRKASGRVV